MLRYAVQLDTAFTFPEHLPGDRSSSRTTLVQLMYTFCPCIAGEVCIVKLDLPFGRALGDANFKEGDGDAFVSNRPDVRHLQLTPADTAIVIASDGLFDVMSDQQAADSTCEIFNENTVSHSSHKASN